MVIVGDMSLTSAQVSMLTTWVNGGGDLIAMRPDKQLAGLLGLTDAGTTLANAYMRVDTPRARRAQGIVSRHDAVPRRRRPLRAQRAPRRGDAVLQRVDRDQRARA